MRNLDHFRIVIEKRGATDFARYLGPHWEDFPTGKSGGEISAKEIDSYKSQKKAMYNSGPGHDAYRNMESLDGKITLEVVGIVKAISPQDDLTTGLIDNVERARRSGDPDFRSFLMKQGLGAAEERLDSVLDGVRKIEDYIAGRKELLAKSEISVPLRAALDEQLRRLELLEPGLHQLSIKLEERKAELPAIFERAVNPHQAFGISDDSGLIWGPDSSADLLFFTPR